MQRVIIILLVILSFASCKSSKRVKPKKETTYVIGAPKKNSKKVRKGKGKVSKADKIATYAKQFQGVRYKWGGTTKSGMDCSGLVYRSFDAHDITLPRISRDIARKGNKIALRQVQKGDLLFFKTGKRGRHRINHVGLVLNSKSGTISFIHATNSRGVIISNFSEKYWKSAFVEARRIL